MIYITTHDNDKDLASRIEQEGLGVAIPLAIGDICWQSQLDEETQIYKYQVCGERKKAQDLVKCINDGRLTKQVRDAFDGGMTNYFLVIECIHRQDRDGFFEFRTGPNWTRTSLPWSRVMAYVHELHYLMGVHVLWSTNVKATVEIIRSLYRFFESPDHGSLKHFYAPEPGLLTNPTLIRKVANQFPNIGWERSLAVEKHFGSIRAMVNADQKEWMQIEGIGKVTARKICDAID